MDHPLFLQRQLRKRHLAPIWAALAGLAPGMIVLDVGSGAGFMAAEYARLSGPTGKVYALEPKMPPQEAAPNLLHLAQDAASPIRLPRPPDIVFVTDTLHHVADPIGVLHSIRAVCGPRTRLLFTEYDPDQPGLVGAKPHRRMARETARDVILAAGFAITSVVDSADEHYAILATADLPR